MSEEKTIGSRTLHLVVADLTLQEVDALVYYAQHDLTLGSGFGNAIAVRGGPSIQKEVKELGPLETCDVAVSTAGELKADKIIHAVGPRFQEPDMEGKLRKTMQNVLAAANEAGAKSIAFPPMGAGFYGYPLGDCAKVMIEEIEKHLAGTTTLDNVSICLGDKRELVAFTPHLGGVSA